MSLFLALTMAAPMLVCVGTTAFAAGNRRTSMLNAQHGIRMDRHLLGLRTTFTQRPAADVQGLAIRISYKQSLSNAPR